MHLDNPIICAESGFEFVIAQLAEMARAVFKTI